MNDAILFSDILGRLILVDRSSRVELLLAPRESSRVFVSNVVLWSSACKAIAMKRP